MEYSKEGIKNKREFLPFVQARKYIQNLKISGKVGYAKWAKTIDRPENIPASPSRTYKDNGWTDWGDYLGTGSIAPRNSNFLQFEDARVFVHSLQLKNEKEWRVWSKSSERPKNIPATPSISYKDKGWKGFGDWLGTGRVANQNRKFIPFQEARLIVHKLNLKSEEEWKEWAKSSERPENIPAAPSRTYKDKGWNGVGDWLGTDAIANQKRVYLPFQEARAIVRRLNIKSVEEWKLWTKIIDRRSDIPSRPSRVYKSMGWKGFPDWLGNGNERDFLPFEQARKYVQGLKISGKEEYNKWAKSSEKPKNIPASPRTTYKNNGWIDWGDYLGTGSVAPCNKKFLKFEDAREYVRNLCFQGQNEFREWAKKTDRPKDIPTNPSKIYKDNGWTDWGDFFGTDFTATYKREFLPFEQARKYVQSLKISGKEDYAKWVKTTDRPKNIPSLPSRTYKNNGWTDWGDYLGTYFIANQNREFIPFEQARKYAQALKIPSKEEYAKWAKSSERPKNIPASPSDTYKNNGWVSWQDWLGVIGNGCHYWGASSIVIYLQSMKNQLINLDYMELITIINSNNLANKFKEIGKLNTLISSEPASEKRKQIIDDLTSYFKENSIFSDIDEDKLIEKSDMQKLFSDALPESETIDDLGTNEQSATQILKQDRDDFKSLHKYDIKMLNMSLDNENLDFLMKNQLKHLWNEILNGTKSVDAFSKERGGKNFTLIKDWFFDEYNQIMAIVNPDDYNFHDKSGILQQPNLMQKLIAYRIKKEKFYGNWSGTGAGKTLSAIYSGRLAKVHNTIIICNNIMVDGWIESIHDYFKNSHVYIKKDLVDTDISPSLYNVVNLYDIHLPENQYNYLILNYETFQQKDSENIVAWLLSKNRLDFVILDEVQNVKQRESDSESIRRNIVNKLIINAREKNLDMLCMVMSATPIINNLYEPKALIELLTGLKHEDLKTTDNIANGIEMYKALTRYGLRYIPYYDLELNQEIIKIDGNHLINELIAVKKGSALGFDQVLLKAKLDAVKHLIKPGTLVYTYFVTEMAEPIGQYIKSLGLSVGYYTGDDKSGLKAFKSQNVDVLVGSAPISTGVNGIQNVCDTLIPICMPWTSAEYNQLIGRIYRQGSEFKKINVYIPQVIIDIDDGRWSWDKKRYNIIQYKATLADLVVDGRIPTSLLPSKSKMVFDAQQELRVWIDRINQNEMITFKRERLTVPLSPSQFEYQQRKLGDFSEFNKAWSTKHSETTHLELKNNPEDWFYYHSLYSEKRKTWSEIPYIEIAKRITRPEFVVADLGCGENLLKHEIPNRVLSFDHVAIDSSVTACDIYKLPLEDKQVDVAVLSLSLMGSNSYSYINEAYRVLKSMGFIIIAEPKNKWAGKIDILSKVMCDNGFTQPNIQETEQFIYLQSFKN